MKAYCRICALIQPSSFRPCNDAATGALYEDLCCDICDFIVATVEERETLVQPAQEPVCPECKAGVLYECVACSSNNYPAQPAQEPVAVHQFRSPHCSDWYDGIPDHHDGHGPYEVRTLYTTAPAAQPAQGPASVTYKEVQDSMNALEKGTLYQQVIAEELGQRKLYTAPPQRPWKELTGNEWFNWWRASPVADETEAEIDFADFLIIVQAIAVELKEKNNG